MLVRHHPTKPGEHEIIAGERRWRAVGLLVTNEKAGGDYPLPIRLVAPCDDRKLLELALTENVARKDMTPLEEAEAFAMLAGQGASPAEIGDVVGLTARTVQKRLRLVRDLTPQVRDALAEDEITVEFANVLAAYCPKSKQNATVEEINRGQIRTTAQLKSMCLASRIATTGALFDLDQYKGGFVEDEENPEIRYFADGAAFKALQAKGVKAKKEELGKKYAIVEVADRAKGEIFRDWNYSVKPGHAKARAVIELDDQGAAKVHLDLVHHSDLHPTPPAAGQTKAPVPAEPTTKPHNSYAHRRKNEVLQAAVAESTPALAMRLTILGLMRESSAVRILPDAHPSGGDFCIGEVPRAIIEEFSGRFAEAASEPMEFNHSGWGLKHSYYASNNCDPAKMWQTLVGMTDTEAGRLFTALVALRVGSFDGYAPELGDRDGAVCIARTLGLVGSEAEVGLALQPQDLDGLRKGTLIDVARSIGVRDANTMKTADLKAAITEEAPKDYVLPSLRFGRNEAIEAMLKGRPHPKELAAAIEASEKLADSLDAPKKGPDGLFTWDPVKKLAELARDIAEDENFPATENDIRWSLINGINAMQRRDLGRPIADTARFDPEEINVGAQFLIDELFEICWPPNAYAQICTLADAIAFVCRCLGIEHSISTTQAAE